jgi:hypothetical protein
LIGSETKESRKVTPEQLAAANQEDLAFQARVENEFDLNLVDDPKIDMSEDTRKAKLALMDKLLGPVPEDDDSEGDGVKAGNKKGAKKKADQPGPKKQKTKQAQAPNPKRKQVSGKSARLAELENIQLTREARLATGDSSVVCPLHIFLLNLTDHFRRRLLARGRRRLIWR